MKRILNWMLFCILAQISFISTAQKPPVQNADYGRIERLRLFSPQMNDTITIDTWLPEAYDIETSNSFPVIYMHDGQNLFDASTTWNHQSWEVDSVLTNLIKDKHVSPAIIVGIHSFPETRVADLMPRKSVGGPSLRAALKQVGLKESYLRGDAYVEFIVNTLKPEIDKKYRTLKNQPNTSVMGSSMGGLMSIYALCEYPEIFGNALCLSTHWIGAPEVAQEFADSMYNYLDANLPSPSNHKLYFDHGTETIDAYYGPAEERMIRLIKDKGYKYNDGNLLNMVDYGAPHEERAWSARLSIPLLFLLGN